VNLRNAQWASSAERPDPSCPCSTCARWSRGYLRHLLQAGEPTAPRLLTIHNLHWLLALVRQIRSSIEDGTFDELRRRILGVWA